MSVHMFADAIPTWTDKEVLMYVGKAVGGTAVTLITLAGIIIPLLLGNLRQRNRDLEEEVRVQKERLAAIDGGLVHDLKGRIAVMEVEIQDAQTAQTKAEERQAVSEGLAVQTRKEADGYKAVSEAVAAERDAMTAARDEAVGERDAERRRIRKAVAKDGTTWTEKVLITKRIDFKELDGDQRRTPVISLLNLKGGVGKTTATASLAATFASRGSRVLMIDLDLQGSLSSLFLSDKELEPLYSSRRLMGDFLEASFDAEFPNLLEYARPVALPGKSMLVPTTDGMAYAETTLNLRWFLREDAARDPRFLLRRELQLKRITDRFDLVLIDCPPFITAGCVNALVASDYVLIPVTPSKQATDRVTVLLERLKEFKEELHPALNVLGVFANRTHQNTAGLTADELNKLSALRAKCLDVWGVPVPVFDSYIKQSVEVRESEDARRPLGPGDDTFAAFDRLAEEIESRLPMFCRPLPAAAPTMVTS